MSLKISVSWPAWSWKSSLIAAIVKKYWMETIDVGQIFRKRAVARWFTIAEYDKIVENNPQEDREIEEETKQFIEHCSSDIIVSRRMWFHILPNIISIRLDVSPQEWAQRVFLAADRGNQEQPYANVEEALVANQNRMSRLKERLLHVYHVDFTDTSHYTKIIDTTGKTFDQNFEELDRYIASLKK